ncbi:MAG: hypothetical protein ACKO86_19915 [Dolichospermum sp.]
MRLSNGEVQRRQITSNSAPAAFVRCHAVLGGWQEHQQPTPKEL